MPEPTYTDQGATFSPDRRYRYRLWRVWDPSCFRVAFVMLNPSTADEHVLDPTLRRCLGFAQRWGFGGFEVANIFALRSTDPAGLYKAAIHDGDPVGPENDAALDELAARVSMVVAGWGTHGRLGWRGDTVRRRFDAAGRPLHVLRLSREGFPCHPLYLPGSLEPTPWR